MVAMLGEIVRVVCSKEHARETSLAQVCEAVG